VPIAGGVTQQLIGEALTLAQTIAERFAQVGFLESEAAAELPRQGMNRAGTRERKWIRFGISLGGSTLAYLGFAAVFGLNPDDFAVFTGAVFLFAGALGAFLWNTIEGP
jgi:hypothetical protein